MNNKVLFVPNNTTVLDACRFIGVHIPRFCFHKKLLIAGNCRMCVVELENSPKPVISCFLPVVNNLRVFTDTPMVKKAREGVLEFLLLNHPLDCPICDQAGECDLQDQTIFFGNSKSRFFSAKRSVEDKDCGPLIKTIMNRCIHCTRCVRFLQDFIELGDLGTLNRGNSTEIGTYLRNAFFKSEFSSCVVDLCPVGALTLKPYSFIARPWELKSVDSIDLSDGVGSSIRVDFKETEIVRVLPSKNENINEDWISDKARFCFDGLKIQQIDRPYFKNSKHALQVCSWKVALTKINALIQIPPSCIYIVFSANLGLSVIKEVQSIADKKGIKNVGFPRKLAVSSDFVGNFVFNTSLRDLVFSDFCLYLGTNPRFEAALLNLKIKKKQRVNMNCFSLGLVHNLSYKTKVVGISSAILLAAVEGRHHLCKYLKKSKNPLLIYSSCLAERIDAIGNGRAVTVLAMFAGAISSTQNGCCFLNQDSNQAGALLLGTASISLPRRRKDHVCFIVGPVTEDDLCLLTRLFGIKNIIFLGSNGNSFLRDFLVLLPFPNSFESQDSFVNLEGLIQGSQKCFPFSFRNKKITDIFAFFFKDAVHDSWATHGIVDAGSSYFFSKANTTVSVSCVNDFFFLKRFIILKQLFHPFMTDFFCSGGLSEFSKALANSSRFYRATFTNFLDKV